jgi:hypothetical protein
MREESSTRRVEVIAPPEAKKKAVVSWKAIVISLILMPINAYWVIQMEAVRWRGHPTTISLFYNVIFFLFPIVVISLLLRRLSPKFSLSQADLLTIYVMLSIASVYAGHDFFQVLVPIIGHAYWFASPENDWARLFHRYIPDWFAVKERRALENFYYGLSSLYDLRHLKAWALPVISWGIFAFVLTFVMICMNVIVRKQWTEKEKLTYPIVELPIQMTDESGFLLKNRTMWIAFGIAGFIDTLNSLNAIWPMVPSLPIARIDLGTYVTERPWNAIGWTPLNLYPFAIGLGFLLPLDLSFSCWFFYLFWKVERIIGAIGGWQSLPRFPYMNEQSAGAYLALCMIAIWVTRTHLSRVWKVLIGKEKSYDSGEPIRYRTAALGILFGFLFLVGFSIYSGLSPWIAVVFFVIYYMFSIAITRMRAELGSPVHDLHFSGPDRLLPTFLGTTRLSPRNLTILSYYYWFNRAYRAHPMPHQLEGFRAAERSGMETRGLMWAMIIASVFGIITAFWAMLHISYKRGAVAVGFASETFNALSSWLNNPVKADKPAIVFTIIGFLFTLFLSAMRMRFIWWSFHPAAFAVSGSWSMNMVWFCILIAWFSKWAILRYGGYRMYRPALPFFFGLILGDFVVGGFWNALAIALGVPIYGIFQ